MRGLQATVDKTAAETERIEEMYKEQVKLERSRRTEQDTELSNRESKILELRLDPPSAMSSLEPGP